jgi:hypothetical protein
LGLLWQFPTIALKLDHDPALLFRCRFPANREELPCWAHRRHNSKSLTETDLSTKSAIDVQSEIDISRIFPALREREYGFAAAPRDGYSTVTLFAKLRG